MRYDRKSVGLKKKLFKSSGLNPAEIRRINKLLLDDGYLNNEEFDRRITKTIYEERSSYRVHVIYIWRKWPGRDDDNNRFLKYVYIKRLRR